MEEQVHRRKSPEGQKFYIPARYVFAAVLTVGIIFNMLLRVALPVALTAMVRRNTTSGTQVENDPDTCSRGTVDNTTASNVTVQTGEYDWSSMTQSFIMTASIIGMLASSMIGARMAELKSPKFMFVILYGLSSLIFMLFPITADWSVIAVIVFQALSGLLTGPLEPVMMAMCASWFPVEERQILGGITLSAMNLGSILSNVMTGNLVDTMGWRFVFYLFSSIVLACTFLWVFLVYDSPNTHPRISEEERTYINESVKKDERQAAARLPWKEILLSVPVWAHIAMAMQDKWLSAILSNYFPTFMRNVLNYSTSEIGNISAATGVMAWLSIIFFGFASQWIRRKKYLSHLATYHVFNGLSTLVPALVVICASLVGCNDVAIIALLGLASCFGSAYIGGSQMNQMDLAINYTSTLAGLNFTLTCIISVVAPIVTGVMTNNKQTLSVWRKIFYVAAAVKVVPFFIYLFFGSVDEQPWNRMKEEETHDNKLSTTQTDDLEAQPQKD